MDQDEQRDLQAQMSTVYNDDPENFINRMDVEFYQLFIKLCKDMMTLKNG
ncbi:hypothetical protein HC766_03025 [Candidatus Gracilibacteria bacterium]|nr:hypothetical protein [Candidatus Gracilibacteria bacterium]